MSQSVELCIVPASAEYDSDLLALSKVCGLHLSPLEERQRKQAILLVALQGAQPVGFVLLWVVADEAEVVDIGVAPEARGQGVGGQLLLAGLVAAKQRGAKQAFLEVRTSNQPAIALYQRFGFAAFAERSRYYADGEDALLMRCCIVAGS